MISWLSAGASLPEQMPSPFDQLEPHPVAVVAAKQLQAELPRLSQGQMFGVLVVRDANGRLGFLRAFSGLLDHQWRVPGFVPPVFDRDAREALEVPGEQTVKALTARVEAQLAEVAPARAALQALLAQQADERAALKTRLKERKAARAVMRAERPDVSRESLEHESRNDKTALRWTEHSWADARARLERALVPLERRLHALERLRALVSRELMRRLFDTYVLRNVRGERVSMRSLFAPGEPPTGAGDCAGPKLLTAAYELGVQPVAMAEFWWGPPPAGGGRVEGQFAAACGAKCGPVLGFMLQGLDVAPVRRFVAAAPSAPLKVLYEDAQVVVVDKPPGVLSVPGKETSESIQAQLDAQYPGARLVHRLDLDTSGVLVAARDVTSFVALQKQFRDRTVRKRYVAWLEGEVTGEQGVIDLALRVDLEHRPHQVHDPVHGRKAVTEWQVLERGDGRTKVAFFPLTGRTHQLRVHASHALGLGVPIVGDRLYGKAGERLMLHAESIELDHPATGTRMKFSAPPEGEETPPHSS